MEVWLCLEETEWVLPPNEDKEEAEWVVTALELGPVVTASVPVVGKGCLTSGGLHVTTLAAPNAEPRWLENKMIISVASGKGGK